MAHGGRDTVDISSVSEGVLKQLTKEELDEAVTLFMQHDEDGGGELDVTELLRLLVSLGFELIKRSEVEEMLKDMDEDDSGTVGIEEFLKLFIAIRNGDHKVSAGFARLVTVLNSTPVGVLSKEAERRGLELKFEYVEVRAATSVSAAQFVLRAVLSGDWHERVGGKPRSVTETRSWEGVGRSTREAKMNAATRALARLNECVPGLAYPAGVLPDSWKAWIMSNVRAGASIPELLQVLRHKGFVPVLNELLMHELLAYSTLKAIASAQPLVARDKLPRSWMKWWHYFHRLHVSSDLLLQLLKEQGFHAEDNPALLRRMVRGDSLRAAAAPHRDGTAAMATITLEEDDAAVLDSGAPLSDAAAGSSALSWPLDFYVMCREGNVEGAMLYLLAGQDASQPKVIGRVSLLGLSLAARNGHADMVKVLLQRGADPNSTDNYGRAALHYAAHQGHLHIIKLLLQAGAHVFIPDCYKETPAIVAASHGHMECVRTLLEVTMVTMRHLFANELLWEVPVDTVYKQLMATKLDSYARRQFKPEWELEAGQWMLEKHVEEKTRMALPAPLSSQLFYVRRRFDDAVLVDNLPVAVVQRHLEMTLLFSMRHWRTVVGRTLLHSVLSNEDGYEEPMLGLLSMLVDQYGCDPHQRDNAGQSALDVIRLQLKLISSRRKLLLERNADDERATVMGEQLAVLRRAHILLSAAASRIDTRQRLCLWGCDAWVPSHRYDVHCEELCLKRIIPCRFGCGVRVRFEEWEMSRDTHERSCPNRPVPCPLGCGLDVPLCDHETHTTEKCERRQIEPLVCRFNCGMTFSGPLIELELIEARKHTHQTEECEKRPWVCNWDDCGAELRAHERNAHRAMHIRALGVKEFTTAGSFAFEVPLEVHFIKVQLWGGGGGGGHLLGRQCGKGGGGAFVEAELPVFPGEVLQLVVGQGGGCGGYFSKLLDEPARTPAGLPAGGDGRSFSDAFSAGGGGGYSALLREGPFGTETLALAGAGGGGASRPGRPGGVAAGIDDAAPWTGGSASEEAGGVGGLGDGGMNGNAGAYFAGGEGSRDFGGGGGGGFFGGGGGGYSPGVVGAGGGGSSYVVDAAKMMLKLGGSGSSPGGLDKEALTVEQADGTTAFAGSGGAASLESVSPGYCGAARILLPRYY